MTIESLLNRTATTDPNTPEGRALQAEIDSADREDRERFAAVDRIAEIRARWSAATPGPWNLSTSTSRKEEKWRTIRAQGRAVVRVDEFTRHSGGESETYCGVWIDDANARAITEAPADLAFLLAEVDRLTEELAAMKRQWEPDDCPHRWTESGGVGRASACAQCGKEL